MGEYIANVVDAKVIAIDGKSSRRSYDGDEKMLHMVSAFATAARVVLGRKKYLIKVMKLQPSQNY